MILPKVRDPRFITVRRGGTLSDAHHLLLAQWAIDCAAHVLPLFEQLVPHDRRPRAALDQARAWMRKELSWSEARQAAFGANAAGRGLPAPARFAALAAGQAAAVPHVAAHELGAAAYAIKAVQAAAGDEEGAAAGQKERRWQRKQLPRAIRALVLDDQRLRNDICWNVFDA